MKLLRNSMHRLPIAALCVGILLPTIAAANTIWSVDGINLYPNLTFQCGAAWHGYCPTDVTNPTWTVGLNGSHYTNKTASQFASPGAWCPESDKSACRFAFSSAPAPKPGRAMNAYRFRVVQGDGDNFQWGEHDRNELVNTTGSAAAIVDGTNHYYWFSVFFPTDFPGPVRFDGTAIEGAFVNFFQFHQDDAADCYAGLPFSMQLKRTSSGNNWTLVATADDSYSANPDVRIWEQGSPLHKGKWYRIGIHIKWDDVACAEPCDYNNPSGGVIEIWVDGIRVHQSRRTTLWKWPSASDACYNASKTPGSVIPVYWKFGQYRHKDLQASSVLWHYGTSIGTQKKDLFCGMLGGNDVLRLGDERWSCDGRFVLIMQGDGNLVLYQANPWTPLWASGTGTGNYAVMQPDGNFVVYTANGVAVWASGTGAYPGAWLALQNDGNLVVYTQSPQTAKWSSNTGGH